MCTKCQYSLFGKQREHCVKCGVENPIVTLWRKLVVAAIEIKCDTPTHPYIKTHSYRIEQLMSPREYKKAMRSKNF